MIRWTCLVDLDFSVLLTRLLPKHMRQAYDQLMERSNARHAGYLTITLDLPHKPRSTGWKSENHHLRGHERQIASHLGLTMSETHGTIKDELASWPERIVNGPHGDKIIKASEADISSAVCSEAIELCHMWAAHIGLRLIEENQNENNNS